MPPRATPKPSKRGSTKRSAKPSPTSRKPAKTRKPRRPRILEGDFDPRALEVGRTALSAWRPPARLTVHQWAERYQILPPGSPEPGPWRSKPYQVEPQETIGAPGVKGTLYIACSQGGGKTSIILNAVGKTIHVDPAPLLVCTSTLDVAKAFAKDRLAPMLKTVPELRGLVAPARARDSGNTTLHKEYPGGAVTMVGANSPSGLASRPKRWAIFDEIDRFVPTSEGDAIKLGERRTEAYLLNRWHGYFTSPGTKLDPSFDLWNQSDQRRWHVPCPHCGEEQYLRWTPDEVGGVVFPDEGTIDERAREARYLCRHCGALWTDAERWSAIERGRWVAGADFHGLAGFHLPAMAVLGRTLEPMVKEWLEAQGKPERLQVFINTVLAEWWEGPGEKIDERELQKRRETYAVPDELILLTLGADVQANRLEYEIVGWGPDNESWSLAYGVCYGDVRTDDAALEELDEVLRKPWVRNDGRELYVRAAGIDTGFAQDEVLRWANTRLRRRLPDGAGQFVFGLKGASDLSAPVWPAGPSREAKSKQPRNLWVVGVNQAKDFVGAYLALSKRGPGFCHFPNDRPDWYFEQLTSERVSFRRRDGRRVRVWEPGKSGTPTEAWDCRVYAYTVYQGIQRPPFKLNLAREADRVGAKRVQTGPSATPAKPQPTRRARARGRRRRR